MKIKATLVSCLFLLCALLLVGCSGGSSSSSAGGAEEDGLDGTTSGPAYSEPQNVTTSAFDASTSKLADNVSIDTTTCTQGYVGASAQATSRLKLLVTKDDMSYNYYIFSKNFFIQNNNTSFLNL